MGNKSGGALLVEKGRKVANQGLYGEFGAGGVFCGHF